MQWRAIPSIALGLVLLLPFGLAAADEAPLWRALAEGSHVALMRHALAPGTGDPSNFALRDCATQRNLSQGGRDQARRIGARFRAQGIETARVRSSQWCRCLETARLLELGPVEELPSLNSFFRNFERREGQTEELKTWMAQRSKKPAILVTHQVNITALTDIFPASGEIVVVRISASGETEVLGTIETR